MPTMSPFLLSAALLGAGLLVLGAMALGRWWRARGRSNRERRARIRREDVLKYLCKCEAERSPATLASVAGTLHLTGEDVAGLLADMERRALVSFLSGRLQLTASGRETGLHVVRAHRLWESHLAQETGFGESDWHAQAEQREHSLSVEETAVLAARLGHPAHDPHGDAIPPAGGVLAPGGGQPLGTLEPGQAGRIVHIEDEPESMRAQLAAAGLRLGGRVQMLAKDDGSLRLVAEGNEHALAPILAQQVDVMPETGAEHAAGESTLAETKPGEISTVLGLSPACAGAQRQRLLDLGFVPGTEIVTEMKSPTGEPTAYLVRGTMIALRREQARLVTVRAAGAGESR